MSEKQWFIRPTDPARRATWQRLFDTDQLPVERPFPRPGSDGDPVYDLDTLVMSDNDLVRLAGFVATQQKREYGRVYDGIKAEGVAVPAIGLELLKAADTAVSGS